MHDKNNEIRKVCDNTLDIIAVSNFSSYTKYNNLHFGGKKTLHTSLELCFQYKYKFVFDKAQKIQ